MTESPEDLSDRELERRLKLGRMGHFAESIDERRDLGESWRERAECISSAPEREALEFIRKRLTGCILRR